MIRQDNMLRQDMSGFNLSQDNMSGACYAKTTKISVHVMPGQHVQRMLGQDHWSGACCARTTCPVHGMRGQHVRCMLCQDNVSGLCHAKRTCPVHGTFCVNSISADSVLLSDWCSSFQTAQWPVQIYSMLLCLCQLRHLRVFMKSVTFA